MEDIYASPPPQPLPTTLLVHLDPQHLRVITNIVSGIIATERAEDAFAQLVDGIPTRPTFEEHFQRPPLLDSVRAREKPTEDSMKLVRAFRQQLDISSLHLDSKIVQAYQNAPLGSWQFQLRLLELAAVAVNALAGMIYSMSHPNTILHPRDTRALQPPHYTLDFYHGAYMLYQDYPFGVLNMVGYWMETRVFGGVLLVEHDDLDCEAKNVFIHSQQFNSQGCNIFQLSESQVHEFFQPFYTESGVDHTKIEGLPPFPFHPEKGVRALIGNHLESLHVFRDEFSRIHPYWPTFTSCVGRMTDEDREIRERFGSRALANPQRRNHDDPNNPDSSNSNTRRP